MRESRITNERCQSAEPQFPAPGAVYPTSRPPGTRDQPRVGTDGQGKRLDHSIVVRIAPAR